MKRSIGWRIAAGILAVSALAGNVQAADFSAEMQQVIDGAKKEGAIDLAWGEGTLGGSKAVKLFEDRINAMFGTTLKIKYTPGPSMPQTGNDIATRQAAGQPSPTDVFIAYGDVFSRLYPRNLFVAAPWQKMMPGRITDAMVESNGAAVKNTTGLVGIGYNTKLAPYEPKTLADFLKPEWKGKISSTPYAANFDILSGTGNWGPEKALDYATKLSDQVSGMMRCNEGERLANGEFIAFVMNCSTANFADMIKKGAPLKNVVMGDFTVKLYTYLAVPKNAPHPNAAQLFVAYTASQQGQAQLWETTDSDLDLYAESNVAKEIEGVRQRFGNVDFTAIDIQWYLDHPEAFANWKKISDIFAKK